MASAAARDYVLSVLDADLDTFEQALAFFDENRLTPSDSDSSHLILVKSFEEHVAGMTESLAEDVTDSSTMKEDKKRLEQVAKRLGYDASDHLYSLEAAIEEVEEHEERRAEERYDDERSWGDEDERVATDGEIETLFDSLDND